MVRMNGTECNKGNKIKNMAKIEIIHYIGKEFFSSYIIAKTLCGKDCRDVDETTSKSKIVTCKKCKLILNNKTN